LQAVSEEVTVSIGLVCFSTATGSLIGPLAVGGIYDTYGTYSPGFIGGGTLGVLGALILASITFVLPPRKT